MWTLLQDNIKSLYWNCSSSYTQICCEHYTRVIKLQLLCLIILDDCPTDENKETRLIFWRQTTTTTTTTNFRLMTWWAHFDYRRIKDDLSAPESEPRDAIRLEAVLKFHSFNTVDLQSVNRAIDAIMVCCCCCLFPLSLSLSLWNNSIDRISASIICNKTQRETYDVRSLMV